MNQDSSIGSIRLKNRELIIHSALREFSQKGFSGTTIQAIADRANLPKPNVHYYFGSKDKLYQAVLSHVMSLWDSTLDELTHASEPRTFIEQYIDKKITFSRENPEASRIFAAEILNGAPYIKSRFGGDYHNWFCGRRDIFKQWQTDGVNNPDISTDHLLFIIWASTQHYADYEFQVKAALGTRRLNASVYRDATNTLTTLVLAGLGLSQT